MNVRNYVNMFSALLVFIGGLVIIILYPLDLSNGSRILIGLIVSLYFFLRMGQVLLAIKRERRKARSELRGSVTNREDGSYDPKSS